MKKTGISLLSLLIIIPILMLLVKTQLAPYTKEPSKNEINSSVPVSSKEAVSTLLTPTGSDNLSKTLNQEISSPYSDQAETTIKP